MNFKLRLWRQADGQSKGRFQEVEARNISADMSFLEMLDEVNGDFIRKGDTLIVTRIDRLARSIANLATIVRELEGKGAALKATEQADRYLHRRR